MFDSCPRAALYVGHIYRFAKRGADGCLYWRCQLKDDCRGRLQTDKDNLQLLRGTVMLQTKPRFECAVLANDCDSELLTKLPQHLKYTERR